MPSRGPDGMLISSKSSLRLRSASAAISSYLVNRALFLACRALGFDRAHSSSRVKILARLASRLPSICSRAFLVSR